MVEGVDSQPAVLAVKVISGQTVPAGPGISWLGTPGWWPGWWWLAGGETAQSGGEVVGVAATAAPGELETVSLSGQEIPGDITAPLVFS